MWGIFSRSLFLATFLLGGLAALGAPPLGVFHYQGMLTDTDGNPITGLRDITFRLFEQPENGTAIWQETHEKVTVESGHFSVDLGSITTFDSDFDFSEELYLAIDIDGETLDPRVKLRPVPKALYAARAGNVDAVDGAPIGGDTPSTGRFTTLATTGDVSLGNSSNDSVVVAGALRIAGGTPGAGKLLVSDADGNASWETVSAPGLPNRVLQVGEGAQYATIQAALAAITDNDRNHRYEIRIAPGTYEGPVDLKPFVSLVGAGSANTVIRLPAGSDEPGVLYADYAYDANIKNVGNTIRDLSLEHESGTGSCYALHFEYAPGLTLRNVRIDVASTSGSAYGMRARDSEFIVDNVSIRVVPSYRGYGIDLFQSSMMAERLDVVVGPLEETRAARDINGCCGVFVGYSDLWLRNSSVEASGATENHGIRCYRGDDASETHEAIVHATRISAPDGQAWKQTDEILGTQTSCAFNCLLEGEIAVTAGDFQLFGCTDGEGNVLRTGNVPAPGTAQKEDNLVNVLTVGSGGEYATIGDALDAITDNDENHPYVVKVGPGIYTERVVMKPYVNLVGAGMNVTKVVNTATFSTCWILEAASNSTVRDISFSQDRRDYTNSAVRVSGAANCVFQDISVETSSTTTVRGIDVNASSLICRDVSVQVTGGGTSSAIRLSDTTLSLSGGSLTGYFGLYSNSAGCTLELRDCDITGRVWNGHGSVKFRDSQIDGSISNVYEGHAVFVGCDVAGAIYNGENAGDEEDALLEFRNGSLDGLIRGYNASVCRVSFSKLALSGTPTPYGDSTIKFFHCHDEDLNEVASPSR